MKAIGELLRIAVTPLLAAAGFRKYGMIYVRQGNGLAWLVAAERSRWNDAQAGTFTLGCGV